MKTEEKETKTETKKEASEKPAKAESEVKEKAAPEKETGKEKPDDKPEEVKKPQTKRSDSMTLFEGRDVDTITRSEITDDFKQAVIDAGAESLAICFQCGTCTGACPSGRRTPYRVRQLVRRSLMGLKDELLADDTIWMCSTCYECQERCPREIKIVDIVKIVRNYASQAGYMAKAHKMTGSYVIKTGHGVPINDATKALRKSVGLSELPPTTHEYPEALEEVQTILKTTKFDSLIGYNWETGEIE
jgi:heterodisulfide reductase subunit C2